MGPAPVPRPKGKGPTGPPGPPTPPPAPSEPERREVNVNLCLDEEQREATLLWISELLDEAKGGEQIAQAIQDALFSPNVLDPHLEPANVVDGLYFLGRQIGDGLRSLAEAIDRLAQGGHSNGQTARPRQPNGPVKVEAAAKLPVEPDAATRRAQQQAARDRAREGADRRRKNAEPKP